MMKIVLIAACIALAAAADADREARTLVHSQDDSQLPEGKFSHAFETSNGIAQQAVGRVKNPEAAPEDQIQEVRGSYSYVDNNGNTQVVNYLADENGFQVIPGSPVQVVIPAPVPAPKAIVVKAPAPAPVVVKAPVAPVIYQPSVINPYNFAGYPYNYHGLHGLAGLHGLNRFSYLNGAYSPYNYLNGAAVLPAAQGTYRVYNQNGQLVGSL